MTKSDDRRVAKLKGLVFDKDGTLFDFDATWSAWTKSFLMDLSGGSLAKANRLGEAIGFDCRNVRFDPSSPVIAGTLVEVADILLPHLPGTTTAGLVTHMNATAARAPQAEVVPLVPFVEGLAVRGLALGVATNDAESSARAHLSSVGILKQFDFVAGCDSGFGAKPKPGQLLAFADAMNLRPEHCAMVGDSRHDLSAARAAGMFSIGVLTGLASEADLSPFADVVLADIGALPAWLDAAAKLESAA